MIAGNDETMTIVCIRFTVGGWGASSLFSARFLYSRRVYRGHDIHYTTSIL